MKNVTEAGGFTLN